jgi:hypothetical protein
MSLAKHLAMEPLGLQVGRVGTGHPRSSVDHEARGIHGHGHIGEHETNALVLHDGAPELDTLPRVVEGVFVGRPADAEGVRADNGAGSFKGHEGAHRARPRRPPALRRGAELVLRGDATIVQDHIRRVAGADAHLLPGGSFLEAWGALRDDVGADTAPALGPVFGGEDDVDIGDVAIGDELLFTVEDEVIPVPDRGGREVGDIGAGIGLGQTHGAEVDLGRI